MRTDASWFGVRLDEHTGVGTTRLLGVTPQWRG